MDPSNDERLNELEAKVRQQSAQIGVPTRALSDLLAAHAFLHKDVRLSKPTPPAGPLVFAS